MLNTSRANVNSPTKQFKHYAHTDIVENILKFFVASLNFVFQYLDKLDFKMSRHEIVLLFNPQSHFVNPLHILTCDVNYE